MAGSALRKKTAQDIPEQTARYVCRVKASRGTLYVFNRGGTVELDFIPNAKALGYFYFDAEFHPTKRKQITFTC